ncbi:hypothetical protein GO613_09130 [Azoarcus communis]|uniref:hypothetical protein n=1 Tax=Parazoarcus communis TaxID=41977 RepID=UPI0014592AF4|nr:hypothetical protein [Parazoarcus communis]NMG48262.1 hypothetical protein [Parazoarcus communis]
MTDNPLAKLAELEPVDRLLGATLSIALMVRFMMNEIGMDTLERVFGTEATANIRRFATELEAIRDAAIRLEHHKAVAIVLEAMRDNPIRQELVKRGTA